MQKVGEEHIPQVIHIFPRGGPSSLRYRMVSPKDIFTSPKEMVGNKQVFYREKVVEMERFVRCIIPPMLCLGQIWHVVQHKNFSQRLSKT